MKKFILFLPLLLAVIILSIVAITNYGKIEYDLHKNIAVVTGGDSIFAIKSDGSLWAWGFNDFDQLGTKNDEESSPVKIFEGNTKSVVSTGDHTIALKSDGSVWTWGSNKYNQLGNNTPGSKSTPQQIISGGVKSISANSIFKDSYLTSPLEGSYNLALKTDGSLWVWGRIGKLNQKGNIFSKPEQIIKAGVQDMAAGQDNIYVLKSDGTLWNYGNLENTHPKKINISSVKKIYAGSSQILILKADGSLWMQDNAPKSGNKKITVKNPVLIMGANVKDVGVYGNKALFIKTDGSLWKTSRTAYAPKIVINKNMAQNITSVAVGSQFILALRENGSLLSTNNSIGHNTVSAEVDGFYSNDFNDANFIYAVTSTTLILLGIIYLVLFTMLFARRFPKFFAPIKSTFQPIYNLFSVYEAKESKNFFQSFFSWKDR